MKEHKHVGPFEQPHKVLIVIYGEELIVRVDKEDDQIPRTLTKNIVLDVVKNELKMDCYYVM